MRTKDTTDLSKDPNITHVPVLPNGASLLAAKLDVGVSLVVSQDFGRRLGRGLLALDTSLLGLLGLGLFRLRFLCVGHRDEGRKMRGAKASNDDGVYERLYRGEAGTEEGEKK